MFAQSTGFVYVAFATLHELLRQLLRNRVAACLLIALLIVDAAVIVTNVRILFGDYVEWLRMDLSPYWARKLSLETERGYPEIYEYLKIILVGCVFARVFARTREMVYFAWAAVFVFVLLDNSLSIHETLGQRLVATVDPPTLPGLRQQDSGELLTWALLGIPVIGALYYGFRSSEADTTRIGGAIAILFCGLIFFAIVVDMIHSAAIEHLVGDAQKIANAAFIIIEDGGEMVMLSIICAVVIVIGRPGRGSP